MKNKNDNEQQPITGERQPTELRGLRPITIGSFCSGYGGLEIGVSRAFGGNTRTVFMVERETFAVANMANKIQEKRMDSALIYNDVRTFPYRKYRGCIDVAVAGIPCQPHSSAGKRKGGGDERFLFDDWLDGISEMRPSYVLIENVEGLCSSKMPDGTLCLGYVFRRLEDVGYQVERADKTLSFGTFSAAEIVGADGRRIPHLRKRVFILAKLADGVSTGLEGHAGDVDETTGQTGRGTHRPISESGLSRTVYPSRPGERQYEWEEPRVVGRELADTKSGSARRDVRDVAETDGVKGRPEEQHQDEAGQPVSGGNERQLADTKSGESGKSQAGNRRKDTGGGSEEEYVGNASSERSHRGSEDGTDVEPEVSGTRHESYVANAECIDGRRERREEQAGQPSGEPIKDSNQSDGRSEAQSELGGTTDGTARGVDAITNRVDRLRLLGNGVVPDCAELAFRTLFNQLHNEQ
jgi:DNA (cytosine-5)-methyltransferase 1